MRDCERLREIVKQMVRDCESPSTDSAILFTLHFTKYLLHFTKYLLHFTKYLLHFFLDIYTFHWTVYADFEFGLVGSHQEVLLLSLTFTHSHLPRSSQTHKIPIFIYPNSFEEKVSFV